jgi:lactobin A/cerein 7B family class IIb bacteriocin
MNSSATQMLGNHMEVMTQNEIDEVSGGIIPLAVAVWYTSGFIAGAAGGWAFGTTIWH